MKFTQPRRIAWLDWNGHRDARFAGPSTAGARAIVAQFVAAAEIHWS